MKTEVFSGISRKACTSFFVTLITCWKLGKRRDCYCKRNELYVPWCNRSRYDRTMLLRSFFQETFRLCRFYKWWSNIFIRRKRVIYCLQLTMNWMFSDHSQQLAMMDWSISKLLFSLEDRNFQQKHSKQHLQLTLSISLLLMKMFRKCLCFHCISKINTNRTILHCPVFAKDKNEESSLPFHWMNRIDPRLFLTSMLSELFLQKSLL